MNLNLPQKKSIVYPVRFDPETFKEIKKLARKNKTTPSKIIRAIMEKELNQTKR